MDLYLLNCLKAAAAAASKRADKGEKNANDTCSTSKQKPPVPEVGTATLLNMPLGTKLPIIPGTSNIYYTTNLSEKLYQPSFGFNLSDPYCRLMDTTYKSLHDPHLKKYYKRKDILRKLKKGGFITGTNKVICSLKEFNKYRHYLTSLKIDFEHNYTREQKIIEKQVNNLYQGCACDGAVAAKFQQWLLNGAETPTPEQEQLIKRRHLHMINQELDKLEDTTKRRNSQQTKEEDRQHWNEVRRKLNLQKQIEEDWKSKEMTFMMKIGEEVKRETKVEEHRRKLREEMNQKKQAMLQKRIAYHLQKLQINDKKETPQERIVEKTRPDETGLYQTMKRTSFFDQLLSLEPREEKRTPSLTKKTSLAGDKSFQELPEPTSLHRSVKKTSLTDEKLLPEHLERKCTPSLTKKTSLAGDKSFQELPEPTSLHRSVKKTSLTDEKLLPEHLERKYSSTYRMRTSSSHNQSFQELLEPKPLHRSMKKTSFADETLSQEAVEQKRSSSITMRTSLTGDGLYEELEPQPLHRSMKKTSIVDQPSFPELLDQKYASTSKMRTSLSEDQSFEELLEPIALHRTMKTVSLIDDISDSDHREQKYYPTSIMRPSLDADQSFQGSLESKPFHRSKKKTSFVGQKSLPELSEQKYLHRTGKKTSFTDPKSFEEPLEQKHVPATKKKTSFADEQFFQELQEAKSIPQSQKRISFADQQAFQELIEAIWSHCSPGCSAFPGLKRGSVQYIHGDKISGRKSITLSSPQRDSQTMTEPKRDKETAKTSYPFLDRGIRNMSLNTPPESARKSQVTRQSLPDISKKEAK